jgi:hypothetical protein
MFANRFKCPYCGHLTCHRSRRRTWLEKHFLPLFVVRPVRCANCLRRRLVCKLIHVPPKVLVPLVLLAECLVLLSVGFSLGQRIEQSIDYVPHRQNASVLEPQVRQDATVGSPLANVEDFLPDPGVLPVKRDIGDDPRPVSFPPRNMPAREEEAATK